jgi:phosphoribosylformylglycinamidine cyclo-ligase
VLALERVVDVHAVAHITGGGIPANLARTLPGDADAVVDRSSWEPPRIFDEIKRLGDIDDEEMAKVFNLGIGMVVVVPADDALRAIDVLRAQGHAARQIGVVEQGAGHVRLESAAGW